MLALFQESRLVDNERSAFALGQQVLLGVTDELVSHGICTPAGGTQQSLEAIRGGIAGLFGQLPAVFAFQLSQQAAEVVLGPLAQVAASKVRAELRQ